MRRRFDSYAEFPAYVPVAARRAEAKRHADAAKKKGQALSPVVVNGRAIASSFWGKAWCDNLETYSDYANRLPRGRTYVRNGSVFDLQVAKGEVRAKVSGSSVYTTTVRVKPIADKSWKALVAKHASGVSSVVELLQGRLPKSLLEALADRASGLFPTPREIELACSCPDWASMCKHVAAVLYGVGARLDASPELFFVLRGVEVTDLAARGATVDFVTQADGDLGDADLGALFGIELGEAPGARPTKASRGPREPVRPAPAKAARGDKSRKAAPPPQPAPSKARTRAKSGSRPRDAANTVTHAALLANGMTVRAIAAWVRAGALEPTTTAGTYRVASMSLTELAAREPAPATVRRARAARGRQP
jgi:uncharacterized Zn finger protein